MRHDGWPLAVVLLRTEHLCLRHMLTDKVTFAYAAKRPQRYTKQLTSCTQDIAYRSQGIEAIELSELLETVLGSSQRW